YHQCISFPMAIRTKGTSKHFTVWQTDLNVVNGIAKEGITNTLSNQNQHSLCLSDENQVDRRTFNRLKYLNN
ncbi:hypothetical protein ACVOPT_004713, partial [Enterobacter hormaechei]